MNILTNTHRRTGGKRRELDVALLYNILRVILPLLLRIKFRKKWETDGNFICRYVLELAKFDNKFIYELWKAPIADQKK